MSASRKGVTALRPIKRDGLSQRSSGEYVALDARSGKVLWLGPPRQANNTAVVKAGDLLFCSTTMES